MNKTIKRTQIKDFIRYRMETGDWKVGDKLPAERDLASLLGLSRVTVRNALHELEKEGIIEKVNRMGSIIKSMPAVKASSRKKETRIRKILYVYNSHLSTPQLDSLLLLSSIYRSLQNITEKKGDMLMVLSGQDLIRAIEYKTIYPDGLILSGSDLKPIAKMLNHKMIPFVIVDSIPSELNADCVMPNVYFTGQRLAQIIIDEKCKNAVFITSVFNENDFPQPNQRLFFYGLHDLLLKKINLKQEKYVKNIFTEISPMELKKLEKLLKHKSNDCIICMASTYNILKDKFMGKLKYFNNRLFLVIDYNANAESKPYFKRINMRGEDIARVAMERLYFRMEKKTYEDVQHIMLLPNIESTR